LISVLSKHKALQINGFIFLKKLHNPEALGKPTHEDADAVGHPI
jgi:hypothetical protein